MQDKAECTRFWQEQKGYTKAQCASRLHRAPRYFMKEVGRFGGDGMFLQDACVDPPTHSHGHVINTCPARYVASKELIAFPLMSDKHMVPHKWDMRAFIFLASFDPLVVYVNHGYIHKSIFPFNRQ